MEEYKNLFFERQKALEKARQDRNHEEILRIYNERTEYNPNSLSSTPEIIKRHRKVHNGLTVEYLTDTYFELLQKIQQADKENNIQELLLNAQLSLGLIEPLIIHSYKNYNSFEIKTIPAIEKGLKYFSVTGIIGQVKNISDLVNFFTELHFYKPEVDQAFKRLELASKIYSLIKDNGDCQQSKIKKALNYDNGKFVSTTVYYMTKIGKLEKYNNGKTNFVKIK
ncbi:hypothetical protein [Allomuricauda sp. NBRC 101325]|uniref:hypothetical protein n=1 Tax=Allomuricauda sp. NBRC 101325 TaxID=1113758 RepID=UPI0024A1D39C|nr:hypothetical protein [Muricauda sp. NBRC 101325]GLU43650.1 hypothetical protein Musp01_12740 [Muricauda sp. NBRC 101325]